MDTLWGGEGRVSFKVTQDALNCGTSSWDLSTASHGLLLSLPVSPMRSTYNPSLRQAIMGTCLRGKKNILWIVLCLQCPWWHYSILAEECVVEAAAQQRIVLWLPNATSCKDESSPKMNAGICQYHHNFKYLKNKQKKVNTSDQKCVLWLKEQRTVEQQNSWLWDQFSKGRERTQRKNLSCELNFPAAVGQLCL